MPTAGHVHPARRAVRLLQEAVGAFPDGAIGPATPRAVRGANDTAALLDRLAAGRIAYYRSLSTFAAFGRGWLKRVKQVRQKARGMVVRGATCNR